MTTKILWFDTETTGLDPVKQDIIQAAGILVIDGKEVDRFNLVCQPFSYENIEEEALKVHGRSVEEIKTYPAPQDAYREITGFLSRYVDKYNKQDKIYIAGQNSRFDKDFLFSFFRKNGDQYCGSFFYHYTLDLMQLTTILKVMNKIHPENLKLESICKVCGVTLSGAHDAMADIEATRECFSRLISLYLK